MLTIAPPRIAPRSVPFQSEPALADREAEACTGDSQFGTLRIDVGTFVADDSLDVDSVPEEQLHEFPAAIVVFLRRASRRGYCPPLPALLRLGFRTKSEVEAQRLAECWRW